MPHVDWFIYYRDGRANTYVLVGQFYLLYYDE